MSLSIPVEARRMPSRVLIFTVCLYGAFIYWSYNAGLVSLLTVENFYWPIKSLEDIVNDDAYRYFKLAYSSLGTVWKLMCKSVIFSGSWFRTVLPTMTFSSMQTKKLTLKLPHCGLGLRNPLISTSLQMSLRLRAYWSMTLMLSTLAKSSLQNLNFQNILARLTVPLHPKHTLTWAHP